MVLSLIPATAQVAPIPPGAKAPPEAKPHHLVWDWRRAEELSWKQSIGRTRNLSASERDRLLAAIADELSDEEFESDEARTEAASDARIKYVALNSDGKSEVIVQAGDSTSCSPVGNCVFWILRRRGNSYFLLLRSEAKLFTLQPSRTHGFLDIVLTRHNSAFDSEVRVYQFDGQSYQESDCYWAEWEPSGAHGESHNLRKPKLTPCGAR